MKKQILNAAMLLCAGAILMTGCEKDNQQVFHLTINDNHAKTALGTDYKTLWQTGDVININGTNLTIDLENGYTSSNQVWVTPIDYLEPVNGQFYAFYAGRGTAVVPSVTSESQSYSFTMPSSYNYNPDVLQSPMAGIGTYGGTSDKRTIHVPFDNLFSLMELTVPIASESNPCTINIIDISNTGVPMWGDFTTTYSNGQWNTVCEGNGSNTLTVTKSTPETTVYIPFPSGSHKLKIILSTAGECEMTTSYAFKPGHYYKINTIRGGDTIIPNPIPVEDSIIYFTGGNLRYFNSSSSTHTQGWSLEPHQWDTTHYVAENKAAVQSSQIGWMTVGTANPQNLNNGGGGLYYYLGYSSLLDPTNPNRHLRVPSINEWTTVLGLNNTTPNYAYVSISYTKNGNSCVQNGLIILPYGVDVSDLSIVRGQKYTNWTGVPQITDVQFGALEKLGCVFLPAFGYVDHTGKNGTWQDNGDGYYRTCDAVDGGNAYAYVLHFTPSAAPNFPGTIQQGEGVAVRLVYVEGLSNSSTSSKSQTISIR